MRNRYVPLFAFLTALAAAACSPPAPPATGTAADEQALRAIGTTYAAAFNARDAKVLAPIVAADYEDVGTTGTHTMGRDSMLAGFGAELKGMPADMKMAESPVVFVKWLSGDHAIIGGTYKVTGTPPGMPNHGAWMAVAVKHDSTWSVVSSLGGDAPPDAPPMVPTKPPAKKP